MDPAYSRCAFNLLHRTHLIAQRDIIFDRAREEHLFLRHNGHLRAQPLLVDLINILAVKCHRARCDTFVQPQDDAQNSRLAGTGRTH